MWADAAVSRFAQVAIKTEQLICGWEVLTDESPVEVRARTSTSTSSGQVPVVIDVVDGKKERIVVPFPRTLWTLTTVAIGSVHLSTQRRSPLTDALIGCASDFWTEQVVPTCSILPFGSCLGQVWIATPPGVVPLPCAVSTFMSIPSTLAVGTPEASSQW